MRHWMAIVFAFLLGCIPAWVQGQDWLDVPEPDTADVPKAFVELDTFNEAVGGIKNDIESLRQLIESHHKTVAAASADWLDDADKMAKLRRQVDSLANQVNAIKQCECGPQLTEDRVREIVKEEISVALEVLKKDATVEKRTVKINPAIGYGDFNLAPGEKLVAVDGVPIEDLQTLIPSAQTPRYYMQATPVPRGQMLPVPVRIVPRAVTRFSTCGPNGCR